MILTMVMSTVIVAAALVALAYLFFRLSVPSSRPADGSDEFSLEKYRPLSRLLWDRDLAFLASQPGYRPEIGRGLRRARRRIVRLYLRRLSRDFDRLYVASKLALLESEEDKPELAAQLLKQRMLFRYALAQVYLTLALDALGVRGLDVRGFWAAVEQTGGRLQALSSAARTA